MEHVGEVMSEGEWNNFSHEMYSSPLDEEANFIAQFLCNSSLPTYQCWQVQESAKANETSMYSSTSDEYNHFHSQGCSSSNGFDNGSFRFPHSYYSSHQVTKAENGAISMDYYYGVDHESPENDVLMEATNDNDFVVISQDSSIDGTMVSNEISHDIEHQNLNGLLHLTDLHLGREHDEMMLPISHSSGDEKASSLSSDIAKKRPPVSPVDNFAKNKRSLKQKNQKPPSSGDGHETEEENTMFKRQNSVMNRWSTDEDDSVAPSRSSSKKGLPNRNGKTRANRGSTIDPRSLYARKRREKINERLQILQNLVPNGTKVDISTMLEEAVQYVNFLQLQIKLLSSDDLWIFSRIAYNGMDIGLDLKIASAKSYTK